MTRAIRLIKDITLSEDIPYKPAEICQSSAIEKRLTSDHINND